MAEGLDNPDAYTVLDDGAVVPGTRTYEFLQGRGGQWLGGADRVADLGGSSTRIRWRWTRAGRRTRWGAMHARCSRRRRGRAQHHRRPEIGNEFDLLAEKTNGSAWLDGDETQAFSEAYAWRLPRR
ncbi:MAG: hypothetical protein R3D80_03275 [Paracoccaceae bacterium]